MDLGQGGGVMHGHLGRDVPEVALHDRQGDAGVQQLGGPRVAEAVGALVVDQAALGVTDLEPAGELAQQAAQGVGAVMAEAVTVGLVGHEQVPGLGR